MNVNWFWKYNFLFERSKSVRFAVSAKVRRGGWPPVPAERARLLPISSFPLYLTDSLMAGWSRGLGWHTRLWCIARPRITRLRLCCVRIDEPADRRARLWFTDSMSGHRRHGRIEDPGAVGRCANEPAAERQWSLSMPIYPIGMLGRPVWVPIVCVWRALFLAKVTGYRYRSCYLEGATAPECSSHFTANFAKMRRPIYIIRKSMRSKG